MDCQSAKVITPHLALTGGQPRSYLHPKASRGFDDGLRTADGSGWTVERSHKAISGGLDPPTRPLELLAHRMVMGVKESVPLLVSQRLGLCGGADDVGKSTVVRMRSTSTTGRSPARNSATSSNSTLSGSTARFPPGISVKVVPSICSARYWRAPPKDPLSGPVAPVSVRAERVVPCPVFLTGQSSRLVLHLVVSEHSFRTTQVAFRCFG